jgi:hypothetical protein
MKETLEGSPPVWSVVLDVNRITAPLDAAPDGERSQSRPAFIDNVVPQPSRETLPNSNSSPL